MNEKESCRDMDFFEREPDLKLLPLEDRQMNVVNRLNDSLFKYLFGRDENKRLLISFLNSVLDDERRIADVTYLDRESSPRLDGGKGCRFDVRAKAEDGRVFHVEVQVGNEPSMFERCVFYACDSYSNQLRAGDLYDALMPVILVGVLGHKYFDCEEVYSHYVLMEKERHEVGSDAIEFHFFELPKLKNNPDTEGRKFYRWLKYLSSRKSGGDVEMQELAMQDPMIAEAVKVEELFKTDPELRFRYMQSELEKVLSIKREQYFISMGEEIGEQRGRNEGISIGEERGIATIVKNMSRNGNTPIDISLMTGVPIEEVLKIIGQKN